MKRLLLATLFIVLLFGCTSKQINQDNSSINSTNTTINKSLTQNNTTITNKTIVQNKVNNFSRTHTDDGKLIIYFFYLPTCPSCQAVSTHVETIGKKYEKKTKWEGYDINFDDAHAAYQQFYNEYNLTPNRSGVPTMLVNNTVLWGQFEIRDNLEKIIKNEIN